MSRYNWTTNCKLNYGAKYIISSECFQYNGKDLCEKIFTDTHYVYRFYKLRPLRPVSWVANENIVCYYFD